MRARRDAALRLLKTMLVASIVIPVALFSYASWISYQDAIAHAVCQSTSYAHSEMFNEKALISSKWVDSDWDRQSNSI